MTAKEIVLELTRQLPDDVTAADLILRLQNHFAEAAREDVDEDLTQDEWDEAWTDEINRRVADFEAGRTVGVPHEEVMQQLREKYG